MDVKKVAKLAQIELTPDEEVVFQRQLSRMATHFHSLASLNTEKVEPLIRPFSVAKYRNDTVFSQVAPDRLLSLAPELVGQLYRVPPVI